MPQPLLTLTQCSSSLLLILLGPGLSLKELSVALQAHRFAFQAPLDDFEALV